MVSEDQIHDAVRAALNPARFFIGQGELQLAHHPRRPVRWEIFHGVLLPPTQTREEKSFESWMLERSGHAVVQVHLQAEEQALYVARSVLVYGWEVYEDEPNVIKSRERPRWQEELVGRIDLPPYFD